MRVTATPTNTYTRDVPLHCKHTTALLVEYRPVRCATPFCDGASRVGIVVVDTIAYEVRLVVLLLNPGNLSALLTQIARGVGVWRTTIVPVKFAVSVKLQSVDALGFRAGRSGNDRASTHWARYAM